MQRTRLWLEMGSVIFSARRMPVSGLLRPSGVPNRSGYGSSPGQIISRLTGLISRESCKPYFSTAGLFLWDRVKEYKPVARVWISGGPEFVWLSLQINISSGASILLGQRTYQGKRS